ncbi:MAG TPA: cytochrome c/FTR1 family iron permease [Arenimonas sp.]|nr:cytochrome c/FTR1 family iron permease [Arenimonas sp.]
MTNFLMRRLVAVLFICSMAGSVWATDPMNEARQAWQLLDYIAVDYAGAVRNGQVVEPGEYAEMQEFAETVSAKIAALPASPEQSKLKAHALQLKAEIADHTDPHVVATAAHALADQLLVVYKINATPATPPNVANAVALYAQQCSACHGLQGHGDGPAAAGLTPKPIAFSDANRAAQRSPLALYQVISQGLSGTAMTNFSHLSEADRWALAFYVGGIAYGPEARTEGEALWRDEPQFRKAIPSLEALSRLSEADLAQATNAAQAKAIIAYLRTRPDVVVEVKPAVVSTDSFAIARKIMDESLLAYRAGDVTQAKTLALSSYLDGVEPVEPAIASRDRDLMRQIETAMALLRSDIGKQAPIATVEAQVAEVKQLFDQANVVLHGNASSATAAFLGSFTILLREGLEALLIVIGMIAFLRKAERREVLPYVHAGWVGALLAGGLTWGVATYFVSISGANREVTEGLSSLFAAVVLLSVGIWMHQKSLAGRWQQYLHEKMSAALTRRSAVFLFSLSFIAVYREVFETILFYAAMWNEQDGNAILAGLLAGSAMLAVTAFLLLRFSMRLPIGKFFSLSSMLIAVLAVVLVGKGVAALQEAGWIAQSLISMPRVEWLGVYPSWQSILAQIIIAAASIIGFFINARSGRALARVTKS